jgi:hypothetical protein
MRPSGATSSMASYFLQGAQRWSIQLRPIRAPGHDDRDPASRPGVASQGSLGIGDISLANGPKAPDHRLHRDGLQVDV